jgi:hypothetical protein
MNAEAIRELLHRRPFEPFEVHLFNGDIHQVSNPEFTVVLKSNVFIGWPGFRPLCALLAAAHCQREETPAWGRRQPSRLSVAVR